mmetsp:Transcript_11635/g.39760  ORF Transcript_11635/g.39760 Transcript_11635/m.39760 type:complete len:244 (-) Transcript_11635:2607-3338(-)
MDCAARAPHISPGWARCMANLCWISPRSHTSASRESRCSRRSALEWSMARTRAKKLVVALVCAVSEMWSVPETTCSCSRSASTKSTTSAGWSEEGLRRSTSKRRRAFSRSRSMFTGMGHVMVRSARSSCSRNTRVRRRSRARSSSMYSCSSLARTSALVMHSSSTRASSHPSLRSRRERSHEYFARNSSSDMSRNLKSWSSRVPPSMPSSPYRNWRMDPWALRTVPSYLTITSSMALTRRRWM